MGNATNRALIARDVAPHLNNVDLLALARARDLSAPTPVGDLNAQNMFQKRMRKFANDHKNDHAALAAQLLSHPLSWWDPTPDYLRDWLAEGFFGKKREIVLDLRRFTGDRVKQTDMIRLVTKTAVAAETVIIILETRDDYVGLFINLTNATDIAGTFSYFNYADAHFPASVRRLLIVYANDHNARSIWNGILDPTQFCHLRMKAWTRDETLSLSDIIHRDEEGRIYVVTPAAVERIARPLTDLAVRRVLSRIRRDGPETMRVYVDVYLKYDASMRPARLAQEKNSFDTIRIDDHDDANPIVAINGIQFARNPRERYGLRGQPPILGRFNRSDVRFES